VIDFWRFAVVSCSCSLETKKTKEKYKDHFSKYQFSHAVVYVSLCSLWEGLVMVSFSWQQQQPASRCCVTFAATTVAVAVVLLEQLSYA